MISVVLLRSNTFRIIGQATKGVWWMPRGRRPMKDAASGDIDGEVQASYDPSVSEWGNLVRDAYHPRLNT